MLENLRFFKEEENDDVVFAENLANLADIYVNEAFSCSHRKHASVHSITKFLPSYSGIQLEEEVNSLRKITSNIKRPISCIIGGSKISTKITVIKNLIDKFDNIVFVGGMANNILKFKKYKIGKSIYEKNVDQIVSEIFNLSEKKNCKVFFPLDVSTGKSVNEKSIVKKCCSSTWLEPWTSNCGVWSEFMSLSLMFLFSSTSFEEPAAPRFILPMVASFVILLLFSTPLLKLKLLFTFILFPIMMFPLLFPLLFPEFRGAPKLTIFF